MPSLTLQQALDSVHPQSMARQDTRSEQTEGCSSFLLCQAAIDRFHEIIRRPPIFVGTITLYVTSGWRGFFDLIQCHSCLDQILNPVADDRHHIAILDDIELIINVSMPG